MNNIENENCENGHFFGEERRVKMDLSDKSIHRLKYDVMENKLLEGRIVNHTVRIRKCMTCGKLRITKYFGQENYYDKDTKQELKYDELALKYKKLWKFDNSLDPTLEC